MKYSLDVFMPVRSKHLSFQLSLEGCVVNDSHAEIVARRCFMIYAYRQLIKWTTNKNESIFQESEDGFFE